MNKRTKPQKSAKWNVPGVALAQDLDLHHRVLERHERRRCKGTVQAELRLAAAPQLHAAHDAPEQEHDGDGHRGVEDDYQRVWNVPEAVAAGDVGRTKRFVKHILCSFA